MKVRVRRVISGDWALEMCVDGEHVAAWRLAKTFYLPTRQEAERACEIAALFFRLGVEVCSYRATQAVCEIAPTVLEWDAPPGWPE